MKATDFLSQSQYREISEKIRNQQNFEFESKYKKKYRFELSSSTAGWDSATVHEGDYIVLFEGSKLFGDFAGGGAPLEKSEYDEQFKSYESSLRFVDDVMSKYCGKEYERVPATGIVLLDDSKQYVQMSLF